MGSHAESKKSLLPKIIIVLIILAVIGAGVYYIFFRNNESVSTNSNTTIEEKKNKTAEEICNELKSKVSHIDKVIVYTAETDTNKLLGRPNQYTSKVNFSDNRISQEYVKSGDAKGGTIEAFDNETDMNSRKEYIESISKSASMFSQYIYGKNYAILRLETDLTPDQAKEYETAFNEIDL